MGKIIYILLLTSFLVSSQEFDGFSIIKTKEKITIDYIDVTRDILYQNTENGLEIVYTPKGKLELTKKEYKTLIKDLISLTSPLAILSIVSKETSSPAATLAQALTKLIRVSSPV